MIAARVAAAGTLLTIACSGTGPAPRPPAPSVADAAIATPDAAPPDAAPPRDVEWLRGSTHVHALPSGDSRVPVPDVIAWYQAHGYDFIFLTDHNKVSEADGRMPPAPPAAGSAAVEPVAPPVVWPTTVGHPYVRWPGETDRAADHDLIVLAGSELTYNPDVCDPPPPLPDGKCRLHFNALGVTARPEGRIEWPDRPNPSRLAQVDRAVAMARTLGTDLVQFNHPQWHWGTTPALFIDAVGHGIGFVEIANKQFARWNGGQAAAPPKQAAFPSIEALWDAAWLAGATVWGVASDDAHHYQGDGGGEYPAGGAYVVVHARREPAAILDALRGGEFYASTGVTLARVERLASALVVEVAADDPGDHVIRFVVDGVPTAALTGRVAAHPVPAHGSVRAVVERSDGARAWTQPLRAMSAALAGARTAVR